MAEVRDTITLTPDDFLGMGLTLPQRIADALPSGRVRVVIYTGKNTTTDSFDTGRVGTYLTDMEWPFWMEDGERLRLTVTDAGALRIGVGQGS